MTLRASGEPTEYLGRNPAAHHFFCPRCGIHVYDRVDVPNMLGRPYVECECRFRLDDVASVSTN